LLDPTNPEMWNFTKNMWTEIVEIFGTDQVHIGCDETDLYQWQHSPDVKSFMKEMNYTNVNEVLYYYERTIIDILRELGVKIMGWYPGLCNFPLNFNGSYSDYPDVTFEDWTGWCTPDWQPSIEALVKQDANVLLSGPYYLVDPTRDEPDFTWQQMYGTEPRNFTGSHRQKRKMIGGELTVWDDTGVCDSASINTRLSPFLGAVAETWWSPSSVSEGQGPNFYSNRYAAQRCRTVNRGLPSKPLDGGDIDPWICPQEYFFTFGDDYLWHLNMTSQQTL